MNLNYFELIRTTLAQQPDQVCIVWPATVGSSVAAESYTARSILNRVGEYHENLLAHGVQAGNPVVLALPVSVELICALLAVMALGATPVLPPAGSSVGQIARLARKSGAGVVMVASPVGLLGRMAARAFGVRICVGTPSVRVAAPWATAAVSAQQAALVSHSSGSTGAAKAIRRSHQVLRAQHEAIKAVFPPWPGQRDFPLFPNILLHNLAAGVVSVLPAVPWAAMQHLDPARIIAQLVHERVQTLTGNAFYFSALLTYLRQHLVALPEVVAVGIGGSPVPEPLAQEMRQFFPNATVHIIYGSSEAEPIAVRPVCTPAPNPLAGYCVGTIQAGLEWRIELLGHLNRGHAVGELWVRGAHVATAPGHWLRTGDYGYVADNQLFLTGRQGNERVHEGVQHYQIEQLLYHLPGVERVAARSDAAGFTVFVQGSVSSETVQETMAKNFPPACCLAVHLRSSLPVDARHHSKILYSQLR